MRVKVLYFAAARDLASVGNEYVELRDGSSMKDLAAEVVKIHPALGRMENSIRYSVNLQIAEGGSRLRDGDEVGVLPPVAGG